MNKKGSPLALFVFLAVMVCFIVASVVISLKNPVYEDQSYFSSKRQVDEQINAILQEQNWFLANCDLYLGVDEPASFQSKSKLIPPYLHSPTYSIVSRIPKGTHRLFLGLQGKAPDGLNVLLYVEKINAPHSKALVGQMAINGDSILLPDLDIGRYKAIFEVSYLRDAEQKRIFFEREIFVF